MKSESTSSALVFKLLERFSVKAIGLFVNIILARLLLPEDYGLLAVVNVFINLGQTFVQSGMGTSLVQNQTTKEDDYSTVFFLSFGTAVLMMGLLFFSAPLIAHFYNAPTLIAPLRVMSFSLLFASLNCILTARLQRAMQFKSIMKSNLFSSIVSGISGIVAACCGLGIWALVIHHFSQVLAVSLSMTFLTRWRPHRVFSLSRAKIFFGYGWKLLISSLVCSLYYDIRSLIIGKRYSTTDLAYYNKAQQYPDLFAKTISDSFKSVSLPVLSRAQASPERVQQLLFRSISVCMFMIAPILLGLAAVADTMIPVLLTDKWTPCIPYLQIFCIGNLSIPLLTPNLSLLMASGDGKRFMNTEIVRRIVMIATLMITVFVFDSVFAIAVGYAIGYWLDAIIVTCATQKYSHTNIFSQILHVWKSILAAGIMAVIVYMSGHFLASIPVIWRLLLQLFIGVLVYLLFSILLRNTTFYTILHRVRRFLKHKSRS